MSSSLSSVRQLHGILGSSSPLLVPAARAILPSSLCKNFPAGLEEDHGTDRQLLQRGTLPWSFHLPGELPSEVTIIREEAESFVPGSTYHLSSANGANRWLEGGERAADCPWPPDPYQSLQGGFAARVFSAVDAAFHGWISVASECRRYVCFIHVIS